MSAWAREGPLIVSDSQLFLDLALQVYSRWFPTVLELPHFLPLQGKAALGHQQNVVGLFREQFPNL